MRNQTQRSLAIPLWTGVDLTGPAIAHAELDLLVVPIPPSGSYSKPEGFAIFPFFDGKLATSIPLTDGVTLTVDTKIEGPSPVRAELRPSGVSLTPISMADIPNIAASAGSTSPRPSRSS